MLSRLRGTPAKPAASESEGVAQLRAMLATATVTEEDERFLTDGTLLRYLRARDLVVSKAHEMVLATLEWRKSFGVYGMQDKELATLRESAASGKMFVLPEKDRMGNAVIVMRPGYENSSDDARNLRYLVYTLERASQIAGDGKFTVVVDYFSGKFSMANSPGVSLMKQTVSILQNHYPERLGAGLLFDAPKFFLGLYKIVAPFIDAKTRQKIAFVKHENAANDEHCKIVLDFERTPVEYGGKVAFEFEVDKYFEVAL